MFYTHTQIQHFTSYSSDSMSSLAVVMRDSYGGIAFWREEHISTGNVYTRIWKHSETMRLLFKASVDRLRDQPAIEDKSHKSDLKLSPQPLLCLLCVWMKSNILFFVSFRTRCCHIPCCNDLTILCPVLFFFYPFSSNSGKHKVCMDMTCWCLYLILFYYLSFHCLYFFYRYWRSYICT